MKEKLGFNMLSFLILCKSLLEIPSIEAGKLSTVYELLSTKFTNWETGYSVCGTFDSIL